MRKQTRIILSIIIIMALLLSIAGCSSKREETATSPPEDLERGNPKLEYVLVQLIRAEKRGEAESFARQSALTLRDDRVLVEIVCVPGQVEAAAKAATRGGAEIVANYKNKKGFGAFVPITSMEALANDIDKSIYRIEVADPGQLNE